MHPSRRQQWLDRESSQDWFRKLAEKHPEAAQRLRAFGEALREEAGGSEGGVARQQVRPVREDREERDFQRHVNRTEGHTYDER